MLRAQEELQALRGRHVLDAKRQNAHLLVHGAFDLAAHLRRLIAARGEHQDHHPRRRDGVDDLLRPVGGRRDVARRDPAWDLLRFQVGHDRVRALAVGLRVADEGVLRMTHAERSRSRIALSRLVRMRLKERTRDAISDGPFGGNSSAAKSPTLSRSAVRTIRRTGRTSSTYRSELSTMKIVAKTA